jgi:hypothetical protein
VGWVVLLENPRKINSSNRSPAKSPASRNTRSGRWLLIASNWLND